MTKKLYQCIQAIATHHDSLTHAINAPLYMVEDLSSENSTPQSLHYHPPLFRPVSGPLNRATPTPSLPQHCGPQVRPQKFVLSSAHSLPILTPHSTHILPAASHTHIKTYPPPPSVRRAFPNALAEAQNAHISVLDPSGNRTRLFTRSNPDAPQPGDILLAIFKSGEPFAGVCLSIRRRGTDTAVLLRNTLMMTGVELWVKIYSPNLRGIEVVQRAQKRARRARLFYMRKPKHDRGSLEKIVEEYLNRRRLLRVGGLSGEEMKQGQARSRGKR